MRALLVGSLLWLSAAGVHAQSEGGTGTPIVPPGDTSPGQADPGTTGETGSGIPNRVPARAGAAASDAEVVEQTMAPTAEQSVPPPAPIYPEGYSPPEQAGAYGPRDNQSAMLSQEELDGLEGGPGARTHEGFFLRLSIGPGAGGARYREEVNDRVSTIEARGLAGLLDVAVGARVVGNLIVHGNLLFTRFDSPTRRVDGVKDAALHVTHSSTMLGAGASYYFMPLNVYLTSSLGLAWAFERRGGEQVRSGTGIFVVVAAGKEWWVGRSGEWGIGTALRTTFAAAPVDVRGVDSTLKVATIGLSFSATFN